MLAIAYHLMEILSLDHCRKLRDHANLLFTERGLGGEWRLDEEELLLVNVVSGIAAAALAGMALNELYHDWGRNNISGIRIDPVHPQLAVAGNNETFAAYGAVWRLIGKEVQHVQS